MTKIISSIVIAIVLFVGGIFIGKYYFSKTDIKVVEKVEYKTIWKEKPAANLPFTQENFDNLLYCATSDLHFKDRTEKNYLFVTAFDACKENTARYEIGTKGDWKVYVCLAGAGVVAGGVITYKLLKK